DGLPLNIEAIYSDVAPHIEQGSGRSYMHQGVQDHNAVEQENAVVQEEEGVYDNFSRGTNKPTNMIESRVYDMGGTAGTTTIVGGRDGQAAGYDVATNGDAIYAAVE
ncbi:hypothetical protein DID78_06500, partial [Candidatus Marinamargulisbacteria bacterium SCGC AG-343-D04]